MVTSLNRPRIVPHRDGRQIVSEAETGAQGARLGSFGRYTLSTLESALPEPMVAEDITALLIARNQGDSAANSCLLSLVCDHLRRAARRRLR